MFVLESLRITLGMIIILASPAMIGYWKQMSKMRENLQFSRSIFWQFLAPMVCVALLLTIAAIEEIFSYIKYGSGYSIFFPLLGIATSCLTLLVTRASWQRHRLILLMNILFIVIGGGLVMASLLL